MYREYILFVKGINHNNSFCQSLIQTNSIYIVVGQLG